MNYLKSAVVVLVVLAVKVNAASESLVLKSNAWTKQSACLRDLVNAVPELDGNVKSVGFPSVNRNRLYSSNMGESVSLSAKRGLGKRAYTIKMKASAGSLFYGTREGSKYYSFDMVRTIVLDPSNGTYTTGEAECEAEVFEGFDAYPVATIDACRCLPIP